MQSADICSYGILFCLLWLAIVNKDEECIRSYGEAARLVTRDMCGACMAEKRLRERD